jgi:hypothetical protein
MKKNILGLALGVFYHMYANLRPSAKQNQVGLISNATAHLGNGQIIENSLIGFSNGKIDLITDASTSKLMQPNTTSKLTEPIKNLWLLLNSTLKLVEID